jgi:hypothetical protein
MLQSGFSCGFFVRTKCRTWQKQHLATRRAPRKVARGTWAGCQPAASARTWDAIAFRASRLPPTTAAHAGSAAQLARRSAASWTLHRSRMQRCAVCCCPLQDAALRRAMQSPACAWKWAGCSILPECVVSQLAALPAASAKNVAPTSLGQQCV